MKIVDEPAAEVAQRLAEQGIEVERAPYDPKSRNLFSDFVRFLRDPAPGDAVTLWEDERGRVRYFTVQRRDPEVAALKVQVAELSRPDPAVLEPRFAEVDAKLARLDELERRVAVIPELQEKAARVDELERHVAAIPQLQAQVARVDELEARIAKVDDLEAQVRKLPELETRVSTLSNLSTRVARLERPA
jgi:hypothetical protein